MYIYVADDLSNIIQYNKVRFIVKLVGSGATDIAC